MPGPESYIHRARGRSCGSWEDLALYGSGSDAQVVSPKIFYMEGPRSIVVLMPPSSQFGQGAEP